jgi:hypothetical protein
MEKRPFQKGKKKCSFTHAFLLVLGTYVAFFITAVRRTLFIQSIVNEEGLALNMGDQALRDKEASKLHEVLYIPKEPITSIMGSLQDAIVLSANETSPLSDCSPTAQVKITLAKDKWFLQTIDHTGKAKSVGGDEMYITYTDGILDANDDPPSAVALIEDNNDGTYTLNFSTTPMNANPKNLSGTGSITVNFIYTCGIGSLPQPSKDQWKSSGSSYEKATVYKVPEPHMKIFQPPNLPDFGKWPFIVFFGDSTLKQMITDSNDKSFRPNLHFKANVRSPFNMKEMDRLEKKFQRMHRKQMLKYERNVSIVTGSAAWDILVPENIQGRGFEDHLSACKHLIQKVLRKIYYGRTIYWKSPGALHMHRVDCSKATYGDCLLTTRYLSNSRAQALHYKQKALMEELDVPYLDLFEAYYLSAHYTAAGDGRHFSQELNELIISWFHPNNKTLISS